MRHTLNALRVIASHHGLYISYYNPGDNPQYKVTTTDDGYFAASGATTVFRAKRLADVSTFLDGVAYGMHLTLSR